MQNSKIEWTDHTFNPWTGCTRVSEGCQNCYAEEQEDHRFHRVRWGPGQPRRPASEETWRQPHRWDRLAAEAGKRHRVFCASLADIMDDEVPQEWRDRLFDLVKETIHLDWLLLTKRPENFQRYLPWLTTGEPAWPNVWLGVTGENQKRLDERVPILCATPAQVRFLSAEPLLSDLDLGRWLGVQTVGGPIDWVIVGGESGRAARAMEVEWARHIMQQCRDHQKACFVKQLGKRVLLGGQPYPVTCGKGDRVEEWPEDLVVREFPV